MAIQIRITQTGKGYAPGSEWRHLSDRDERIPVADLKAAREYLRERYGRCKRVPMFVDAPKGTKRIGWVFGYRMSEGGDKWLQQDWVALEEVRAVDLDAEA